MAIWFTNPSLSNLNASGKNTCTKHLGIEITRIGEDFLEGAMPVDKRTIQPFGLLHGGASCVLAESLGSIASNLCLNPDEFYAVGLEINANHIRSAKSGQVIGQATPIHLGKRTQVWEIKIRDQKERLICLSRLTMAVLPGYQRSFFSISNKN